jgi:hypothetical protein
MGNLFTRAATASRATSTRRQLAVMGIVVAAKNNGDGETTEETNGKTTMRPPDSSPHLLESEVNALSTCLKVPTHVPISLCGPPLTPSFF